MKIISSIFALLALACFLIAIWSSEQNVRWAVTGALGLIVAAGVWGTHLNKTSDAERHAPHHSRE